MAAFLLAHLSDPHLPHLPAPRAGELFGKRALGYLNWTRNRHSFHRRDVLDALVTDMQAQHPDHIAITGDLVNLSLDAEFAPARAWLQGVGAPDKVSLVPGNHDTYVRATRHEFARTFGDYIRGDSTGRDAPAFPFLRRHGPLALIGVSTAVPSGPLMATGELGQVQRDALVRMLAELSGEPLFRVLLIHHPLRSRSRFKRLTDSDDLLAILRRHGVDLILHGHDHVHATTWIAGSRGWIPSIGVPSASAIAHGRKPAAAYNLFSIERVQSGWRCAQCVRGFGEGDTIHELQRVTLRDQ